MIETTTARCCIACPFIAFMHQWDLLDFLARHASTFPTFRLRMRTEATGLLQEQGRVVGVDASTPPGRLRIRADLVVAADGRHSVLRDRAGLPAETLGAPMDVLWFRLPRAPGTRRASWVASIPDASSSP